MKLNDSTIYEGAPDLDEAANLCRRARAARAAYRAGEDRLFLDLSQIPIPSTPRFYGLKAGFIRALTPRQAWKAERHRKRREKWVRDLAKFWGKEGAERIAYWLR